MQPSTNKKPSRNNQVLTNKQAFIINQVLRNHQAPKNNQGFRNNQAVINHQAPTNNQTFRNNQPVTINHPFKNNPILRNYQVPKSYQTFRNNQGLRNYQAPTNNHQTFKNNHGLRNNEAATNHQAFRHNQDTRNNQIPTNNQATTNSQASTINQGTRNNQAQTNYQVTRNNQAQTNKQVTRNNQTSTINQATNNQLPINSQLPSTTNNSINSKINYLSEIVSSNKSSNIERPIDEHIQYHNIYAQFQNKVNLAAMNQKIFTIYGQYPTIRRELLNRGWIEKIAPNRFRNLKNLSIFQLLSRANNGNDYETMALSKLMEYYPIKFHWLPKHYRGKLKQFYLPYINSIKRNERLDFTSKDGLIGCVENSQWNIIDGLGEINVPRYHRLRFNTEHIEFLDDYRTTYCLSLLQYIREATNIKDIFNESGTIPINIIEFALKKIHLELNNRNLSDDNIIKGNCQDVVNKTNNINMEWMTFYYNVDHLVNGKDKINLNINNENDIKIMIIECKNVMRQADKYWPQIKSDGYNNLWIIKPAHACRGWGITIKNNFENILGYIGRRNRIRYIVQKYIERPLLIYNTKFDIRQYLLITITDSKFNIWMYKDCYLRFSSQQYKLDNLNESVHITNNAVQRKYKNGIRSNQLPPHNMWTLIQFQAYLKETGNDGIWNKKIYPGMQKNIIAVILTSLEETEIHPNLFELYGCDFMINENYEPILIEINATPDMTNSTCVTGKLCPAVLIDVIKVVIDLPKNENANIGQFELVHSIPYTPIHSSMSNVELEIVGKRLHIPLNKKF